MEKFDTPNLIYLVLISALFATLQGLCYFIQIIFLFLIGNPFFSYFIYYIQYKVSITKYNWIACFHLKPFLLLNNNGENTLIHQAWVF